MICNGYLIQVLDQIWCELLNGVRGIVYGGMCAYEDFPLRQFSGDPNCRSLTERQAWAKNADGLFVEKHFISDGSLLLEYLSECFRRHINVRLLRIESDDYEFEVCDPRPGESRLLGYEICSLPLDNQILSDLRFDTRFAGSAEKLNQLGIFSTLEEARAFREEYLNLLRDGLVGDGEADVFTFAVFEEDLPDPLQPSDAE